MANRFRVLVVDDIIINLNVLSRILRRVGVEEITCIDSGPKALAELEKKSNFYNLVLTDLQMPEMTGMELMRRILQNNGSNLTENQRLSTIVGLTAEVSEVVDVQFVEAGTWPKCCTSQLRRRKCWTSARQCWFQYYEVWGGAVGHTTHSLGARKTLDWKQ